jgi:glutaredoxin-like protein NrdH
MNLEHIKGKDKGRIVLYALSTCPWCKKTKNLLNELGVDYYFCDVDLLDDAAKQEALKEIEKWNSSRSFPTLVIDNRQCIVGFQESKIRGALNL